MSDQAQSHEITSHVTDIVSAFVTKNAISPGDLPALIQSVAGALKGATNGAAEAPKQDLVPAVPVKKSIQPDWIVCLEDGKKFKSLKRHLATKYGMTPDEYRAKWGLDRSYPMVAPAYAAQRSELAKSMGLGAGGRKGAVAKSAAKAPAKAKAKK